MATLSEWAQGARPRTLPAALAPVLIGTGFAAYAGHFMVDRALLALVVALALQIGVNYANDYSDGIKGTDAVRVGPVRLVGQQLAKPSTVRAAAWACMAIAMAAGLGLVLMTQQWWLIAVGAACVLAAWFYTGGPKPYGYLGLGEVFVFVFFGLVPVTLTTYVQTLGFSASNAVAACAIGLLICDVLVANNLRDIPTDVRTGKRTLAVRLGDGLTRRLYEALIVASAAATVLMAALSTWWLLLALVVYVLAWQPLGAVRGGAAGRDLICVLKQTGNLVLAYGLAVPVILVVVHVLRSS